jgi:ubiquinone/menaquinone biosynthesis C-methylase UbiE
MAEAQKGTGGFLNPQKVLNQLEIQSPSKIAHFGCGHGYFTIPLARMVGKEGQIFAIDILNEALIEVKEKAKAAGISNIETLRGNLEVPGGSKLPDNSCDLALLANILFQSNKKADIIREARRIIKIGGKLVIIDWEPTGTTLTSDSGWRISQGEIKNLATTLNLSLDREFDAGDFHYGLIFRKF